MRSRKTPENLCNLFSVAGTCCEWRGAPPFDIFPVSAPTAGEVIAVEYTPVPELRGEDQLRLRARFRTSRDVSYNDGSDQVAAAELERGRGGVFRGLFTLPAEAVFAVEDLTGERVDHNRQAGILNPYSSHR